MNKLVLLFLFALFNLAGLSAQTYYYERTAKIDSEGHRIEDSGDGHFITFTSLGCYDSDNEGMTAQTGFRKYQKSHNGVDQYYGKSYFGQAYYRFSTDKSRLNVDVEYDGTIFVYERKSAPTTKTSSMRGYSPIRSPSGTYVPFNPIWSAPAIIPAIGSNSASSSSTDAVHNDHSCRACGGTGKCTACNGAGYYLANTGYYVGDSSKSLIECGACHTTGRCQVCYGRGEIR